LRRPGRRNHVPGPGLSRVGQSQDTHDGGRDHDHADDAQDERGAPAVWQTVSRVRRPEVGGRLVRVFGVRSRPPFAGGPRRLADTTSQFVGHGRQVAGDRRQLAGRSRQLGRRRRGGPLGGLGRLPRFRRRPATRFFLSGPRWNRRIHMGDYRDGGWRATAAGADLSVRAQPVAHREEGSLAVPVVDRFVGDRGRPGHRELSGEAGTEERVGDALALCSGEPPGHERVRFG
jgi:hypothetical protein